MQMHTGNGIRRPARHVIGRVTGNLRWTRVQQRQGDLATGQDLI